MILCLMYQICSLDAHSCDAGARLLRFLAVDILLQTVSFETREPVTTEGGIRFDSFGHSDDVVRSMFKVKCSQPCRHGALPSLLPRVRNDKNEEDAQSSHDHGANRAVTKHVSHHQVEGKPRHVVPREKALHPLGVHLGIDVAGEARASRLEQGINLITDNRVDVLHAANVTRERVVLNSSSFVRSKRLEIVVGEVVRQERSNLLDLFRRKDVPLLVSLARDCQVGTATPSCSAALHSDILCRTIGHRYAC
ncbi:hypothetical protein H310_04534 [Aphanomyces invadans]|uniref:Uncharacterized protein n=1 Tax=Aphanomyces invadans TaxID=157072 RepID=A0A024UD45_9STRA|nr:hypothetical protein H310_04534 [Aphanomyces invadans]ETW04189.1 hypothetical protein H310_04534 [Aphanomyces invadans]|eukprot:XP_008867145.1 hypothetical protein H310_04534 [Aphanomyces invadans]